MLDTVRIQTRRLQLGMSQRELARQMGESPPFIRSLELGDNHEILTLANVRSLATALGVGIPELFAANPCAVDRPTTSVDRLIAVLMNSTHGHLPMGALSRILDADSYQLNAMIEGAEKVLRSIGLVILRSTNGDAVRLSYDASLVSPDDTKVILRAVNSQSDIDEKIATLIYKTMKGEITAKSINASPTGRLVLGRAINAGWIKPPVNELKPLELTDEVRESLLLY